MKYLPHYGPEAKNTTKQCPAKLKKQWPKSFKKQSKLAQNNPKMAENNSKNPKNGFPARTARNR